MERWKIGSKLAALLALSSLLSACNTVYSEKPWFAKSSGPVLRDGLWLTGDPKCKVNEAKPAERWPECASWGVVQDGRALSPRYSDTDKGKRAPRRFEEWKMEELLLVAGEPMI